jgi:predicted metal-dependent hydrolase
MVIERLEKNKKTEGVKPRWTDIRRKYPTYYWPQLLLEEIIRNASKKQREKIKTALGRLEEKTELYNQLSKLLHQKYGKRGKYDATKH